MPILPDPRQEKFAELYAQGKMAVEAYVQAGYKPNASHACRMRDKRHVTRRIEELMSEGAAVAAVTLQSLIADAARLQNSAEKAGMFAAAITALIAKAKLAGFWVERSDNNNVHYYISDAPMSCEEWKAKYVDNPNWRQNSSAPAVDGKHTYSAEEEWKRKFSTPAIEAPKSKN